MWRVLLFCLLSETNFVFIMSSKSKLNHRENMMSSDFDLFYDAVLVIMSRKYSRKNGYLVAWTERGRQLRGLSLVTCWPTRRLIGQQGHYSRPCNICETVIRRVIVWMGRGEAPGGLADAGELHWAGLESPVTRAQCQHSINWADHPHFHIHDTVTVLSK